MKKVYCVMEGGDFQEGAPYGIFETIEEAVNFTRTNVEPSLPDVWKGSTYIFCYNLGHGGFEKIFNYLGKEIKK